MTTPPPPRSMPRQSFAMAIKDYTFIRPGIAVIISAACLIIGLFVGVLLIRSLRAAAQTVDLNRRTAFTLHGYNAALETWHQLVTTDDPELMRPESRALRDSIRTALVRELNALAAGSDDPSYQQLINTVVKGLSATTGGMSDAGRESMIVVLARQDQAMLAAVETSQRAVMLAAVLIAVTLLAAGTLVVPMAWLYIRYKRGTLIHTAM